MADDLATVLAKTALAELRALRQRVEALDRQATRHRLILNACRTAIDMAGAPLCYVHAQPDQGPVYVIVTHEAFERLTRGSTATEAEWLNHGHVEPDDDLPDDG